MSWWSTRIKARTSRLELNGARAWRVRRRLIDERRPQRLIIRPGQGSVVRCVPLVEHTRPEDAIERLSELPAHGAVQDEVDCSVEQRQDVHQLAEVPVAVVEELVAQDAAQQREYPLRELRDQEEEEHREQHARRPVVLLAVRALLARGVFRAGARPVPRDVAVLRLEVVAPLLGAHQRPDELEAEDRERHARDELDDDAVRPEVDVLQEAAVRLGQLARAEQIEREL